MPFETAPHKIKSSRPGTQVEKEVCAHAFFLPLFLERVLQIISETICAEYGIDREKMESVMDDSGSLRYHWIRVQKEGDGFSRREIHYMIHTMRKDGKLTLPNSTQ